MIYKVTNLDGLLLRCGVCGENDLEAQARDGELATESTEEEIAELRAARESMVVEKPTIEQRASLGEAGLPHLSGLVEVPEEVKRPVDPVAVVIRALSNAGVKLDLEAATKELLAQRAAREQKITDASATKMGGADPVSLAILALSALLALGAAPGLKPGQKHFWEFWKKNPVMQVNQAQAAVDAAKVKADADAAAAVAAVNAEREKQLKIAQDSAHATGSAIAAAQTKTAEGSLPLRELETARQINATNTQAMDQALGAADPARLRELETMVRDLNAGVAAGAKALELINGHLEKTVTEKAALQVKLEQAAAENKLAIAAAEKLRNDATVKEQAWALERDGVARAYERIWFWGKVAAAVALLVVGYLLVLFVRVRGLTNFGKDAVGLTEMLKGEIKQHVSAEEFAKLKDRMRSDWMTTHDGTAQLVDKFKAALRL